FADVGLDVVEPFEKIIVPGDTAVLAVGDRVETDVLLLADQHLDLAVLDLLQRLLAQFAALALLARLFEGGGAQLTPDVIGAERRFGALHCLTHSFDSSPAGLTR